MKTEKTPSKNRRSLILLDTNVLVHAAYRQSPHFPFAARLLQRALRQSRSYCIAPQNIIEFCAVVTRKRFVDPPLPASEVSRIAQLLYRSRKLAKIYPLRASVRRAVEEGVKAGIQGAAWYDAFLVATMRDAGVAEIVTENVRDFARFSFLRARPIREAVEVSDTLQGELTTP